MELSEDFFTKALFQIVPLLLYIMIYLAGNLTLKWEKIGSIRGLAVLQW